MENSDQKINDNEIVVTLGVFSGRPNPVLNLDREDAEKLAEMVHGIIGKEAIHPPPHPKLGEFYGFSLKVPGELSKQFMLPKKMGIYSGVLTEGQGGEQRHWRDPGKIENFLTGYAFKKGLGKFLEPMGIKNPSGDNSDR